MWRACICAVLILAVAGCAQSSFEDDMRGVPVTNNPNLLPKSAQTAQGPSF